MGNSYAASPRPFRCRSFTRRRTLRRAAVALLLAAVLRTLALAPGVVARRCARDLRAGPARKLAYVPVYDSFPYTKVHDCFTSGLQMFPLELARCVAWTSV